ncbi:Atg21p [Ascoidea rubescens DSM 1968]
MSKQITCINFNQDFSCVAIGTNSSYKIFNCDPFGECFEKNDDGGATIIEMLFSTSLIAIVGNGLSSSSSTRRLKIINTKRKSVICELTFPSTILNVKLNRKRLVVVLLDQIFIYDVSCMKLLHTIETSKNLRGLISLSPSDSSILAYPAPASTNILLSPIASDHNDDHALNPGSNNNNSIHNNPTNSNVNGSNNNSNNSNNSGSGSGNSNNGMIILFDALNIQPINIISAHKSPLISFQLNNEGNLLATASIKGTIIRVFNVLQNKKIYEFRRGMAGTLIHSINFNYNSNLLCCSSNNETIHIFKLSNHQNNGEFIKKSSGQIQIQKQKQKQKHSSLSGMFWQHGRNLSKTLMNNYLPPKLSNILEPVRDFAYIKLPNHNSTSSNFNTSGNSTTNTNNHEVALNHNSNYVMIICNDGNFYIYNVPLEKGGECVLVKQYFVLDN